MQMLGYVNFNVRELIKIWETKVKKHFFKIDKTRYDEKIIEYWRRRDFYVEYMVKKYEKMELITKEGIMRPRMLDYAEVIINVEERLRQLTRLNILNRSTIKNYVKMYCRKEKIVTSIVGEELMTQEVEGILNLWKQYFKIIREQGALSRLRDSKKIDEDNYRSKYDLLEGVGKELIATIEAQKEEMERYREINRKYNEVKTDGRERKA